MTKLLRVRVFTRKRQNAFFSKKPCSMQSTERQGQCISAHNDPLFCGQNDTHSLTTGQLCCAVVKGMRRVHASAIPQGHRHRQDRAPERRGGARRGFPWLSVAKPYPVWETRRRGWENPFYTFLLFSLVPQRNTNP